MSAQPPATPTPLVVFPRKADPRGLDKPETYEANPELATLARRLAEAEFKTLSPGTISMGDLKREYLAGKHPGKVAAALDAKDAAASKAKKSADALTAPPGYSVESTPTEILLRGPFDDDLHARIKRMGGRWDGTTGTNRKLWVVPPSKASSLGRVLANWQAARPAPAPASAVSTADPKAGEAKRAELFRAEILRWLDYVEHKANSGNLYQKGVDKLRELGIEQHPDLNSRLDAAIEQAKAVGAGHAPAPIAPAPRKLRVLYPSSMLPTLHRPVRMGKDIVVFTGFGEPFRISEDHPSVHGSHLLGHEGERGRYAYYRLATADEAAAMKS